MFTHIADSLCGACIITCLFLAAHFQITTDDYTQCRKEIVLRRLTSILMFTVCCCALSYCLSWFPIYFTHPAPRKVSVMLCLWVLPELYLIITELTKRKPITKVIGVLPFVPVALMHVLIFIDTPYFEYIYAAFVALYMAFNIIMTFVSVHYYKAFVRENYSEDYGRETSWIIRAVVLIGILFTVWLGFFFFEGPVFTTFFMFINLIVWPLGCFNMAKVIQVRESMRDDSVCVGEPENEHVVNDKIELNPTSESAAEAVEEVRELSKDELFLKRLKEVCEDTKLYTTEDLTREDLSRAMMLNHSYLTRRLKSATGKTFYEYINSLRMQYAEELLRDPNFPLDAIPLEVGYRHRSTYYRVFGEKFGCTPTEYRAKVLAK